LNWSLHDAAVWPASLWHTAVRFGAVNQTQTTLWFRFCEPATVIDSGVFLSVWVKSVKYRLVIQKTPLICLTHSVEQVYRFDRRSTVDFVLRNALPLAVQKLTPE
jgi:hypothetical protein